MKSRNRKSFGFYFLISNIYTIRNLGQQAGVNAIENGSAGELNAVFHMNIILQFIARAYDIS